MLWHLHYWVYKLLSRQHPPQLKEELYWLLVVMERNYYLHNIQLMWQSLNLKCFQIKFLFSNYNSCETWRYQKLEVFFINKKMEKSYPEKEKIYPHLKYRIHNQSLTAVIRTRWLKRKISSSKTLQQSYHQEENRMNVFTAFIQRPVEDNL